VRSAARAGDGGDWHEYDARANRPRIQDPLANLVAREALHRRLVRAGVIALAIAALIVLVLWAIRLADNLKVEDLASAPDPWCARHGPAMSQRRSSPDCGDRDAGTVIASVGARRGSPPHP